MAKSKPIATFEPDDEERKARQSRQWTLSENVGFPEMSDASEAAIKVNNIEIARTIKKIQSS